MRPKSSVKKNTFFRKIAIRMRKMNFSGITCLEHKYMYCLSGKNIFFCLKVILIILDIASFTRKQLKLDFSINAVSRVKVLILITSLFPANS